MQLQIESQLNMKLTVVMSLLINLALCCFYDAIVVDNNDLLFKYTLQNVNKN